MRSVENAAYQVAVYSDRPRRANPHQRAARTIVLNYNTHSPLCLPCSNLPTNLVDDTFTAFNPANALPNYATSPDYSRRLQCSWIAATNAEQRTISSYAQFGDDTNHSFIFSEFTIHREAAHHLRDLAMHLQPQLDISSSRCHFSRYACDSTV